MNNPHTVMMAAVAITESAAKVLWTVFAVAMATVIWRIGTSIRELLQQTRLLRSFPSPPDKHWLFGHVKLLPGNEEGIQNTERLTQEFSHYYVLSFPGSSSTLSLVHPDTVKTISSTEEPKNRKIYSVLEEWIGQGLLISSGKKWKRNRRLLTPAFHFGTLKPYVKVYNECANVMLDKWKNSCANGPIEMFESVSLLTLDIMLRCLFSEESNCQLNSEHNDYVTGVQRITMLMRKRVRDVMVTILGKPYYNYLTQDGRQWRRTIDMLHGYSGKLIELRKSGKTRTDGCMDFLDILLGARDDDGNGLTEREIQAEVDTFMFEGHDTTASGLSWFLYNLARHPEYQRRCRQEVDQLLDGKDRDEFEWNDVSSIPYLTACLKESLRMYPPVPNISKRLTKSHQFPDGKVLHPGVVVTIAINSLHHNPHVWENPDVYDPERFSAEKGKSVSSHAFIPFSAGPRNCIGQKFAMDELKVVAALILRHFELSVDGCPAPRRMFGVVLRTENGIHLNLKPRSLHLNKRRGGQY